MTDDFPPDEFLRRLRNKEAGAYLRLERILEQVDAQMFRRASNMGVRANTRESVRSSTQLRFVNRVQNPKFDLTRFKDMEQLVAYVCRIYLNIAIDIAAERNQRPTVDLEDALNRPQPVPPANEQFDEVDDDNEELDQEAKERARDATLRERVDDALRNVTASFRRADVADEASPAVRREAYIRCLKRPLADVRPVASEVAEQLGIVVPGPDDVLVPDERAIARYRSQVRVRLKKSLTATLPAKLRVAGDVESAATARGRGANQDFDDWIAEYYFKSDAKELG